MHGKSLSEQSRQQHTRRPAVVQTPPEIKINVGNFENVDVYKGLYVSSETMYWLEAVHNIMSRYTILKKCEQETTCSK